MTETSQLSMQKQVSFYSFWWSVVCKMLLCQFLTCAKWSAHAVGFICFTFFIPELSLTVDLVKRKALLAKMRLQQPQSAAWLLDWTILLTIYLLLPAHLFGLQGNCSCVNQLLGLHSPGIQAALCLLSTLKVLKGPFLFSVTFIWVGGTWRTGRWPCLRFTLWLSCPN